MLLFSETEQGVALAILRGVIDFKREPWPQVSESAKSLVRQMLEPDPKKRLTAQQVLGKSSSSSFFMLNFQLVSRTMLFTYLSKSKQIAFEDPECLLP